MGAAKKTDNASLATKVALRCWLLERLGMKDVHVLDTCSGLGKIWEAMGEHVTIRQWTRCDHKPRRAGALAIEATRALEIFPVDVYNVVDIDPYGEPWEPFRVFLRRFSRPTAVFLTHGHVMNAQVANVNLAAVGIPLDWPIPRTPSLSAYVAEQQLSACLDYARVVVAARVVLPRVSYYALGLEPKGAKVCPTCGDDINEICPRCGLEKS
jgi:hypothetical protein